MKKQTKDFLVNFLTENLNGEQVNVAHLDQLITKTAKESSDAIMSLTNRKVEAEERIEKLTKVIEELIL